MCSSSSKSPVSPVGSSAKSSRRSCSWSQARVSSSAGKTAPGAPSPAIMFAIVPRSGERGGGPPGPGKPEDAPGPAADTAAAQQLEDHVLRLNPRTRELILEEDADDLGAGQLEGMSCDGDGHFEAAPPA